MSKRYLFCLRHYNDIDNIAPVIFYFLSAQEDHYADVFIYGKYDYSRDANIAFLREQFPNRVRVVGAYDLSLIPADLQSEREQCVEIWNRFFGDLLRDGPPLSLIVFDVARTGTASPFAEILRHQGVRRMIALPVAPLINVNVLREYPFDNIYSYAFDAGHDYSFLDEVAFVDDGFYTQYEKFMRIMGKESSLTNKVTFLGSLRYSDDWLRRRPLVRNNLPVGDGRIKVVLFLSHPKSNVNMREVEIAIRVIRQFPDYELIVKAHPRDYSDGFAMLEYGDAGNHIDSSELIQWADIVMFWSTSVAIEGYIRKKTMVCLNYMVSNVNLYAQYNAGYVAHCRDDLYYFLETFRKNPDNVPYDDSGVEHFLREILHYGEPNLVNHYLEYMQRNERALAEPSLGCPTLSAVRTEKDWAVDQAAEIMGHSAGENPLDGRVSDAQAKQILNTFLRLRACLQVIPELNSTYQDGIRRMMSDRHVLDAFSLGELFSYLWSRIMQRR